MRIFIAIDLPDLIKNQLASLRTYDPRVRWVDQSSFHLTLRFLGETSPIALKEIISLLETIKSPELTLQIKGVDFFGPSHSPRLLYARVVLTEELSRLKNKIDYLLKQYGLSDDQRKYSPHITLARISKTSSSLVGPFIQEHSLFQTRPFGARSFTLFSSKRLEKGTFYHTEYEFPLLGPINQYDEPA